MAAIFDLDTDILSGQLKQCGPSKESLPVVVLCRSPHITHSYPTDASSDWVILIQGG